MRRTHFYPPTLHPWSGKADPFPHAAPLLGTIARECMQTDRFPAKPDSIVQWQEREIIAGVTDPMLTNRPRPATLRIVSPTPDLELHPVGEGPVLIRLQAAGTPGLELNWFRNGEWLFRSASGQVHTLELPPGPHKILAIATNGAAAETRLHLFSP